jgi:hypothetical protein
MCLFLAAFVGADISGNVDQINKIGAVSRRQKNPDRQRKDAGLGRAYQN